jgi:O-antigen/teichoic acid export membrane protein
MALLSDLFGLRKNPVAQSIGIYTFTSFLGKGVSFLLIFIYTNPKYINPSENGLLSLFSNGILFLMPFISLGILQSTSTDFFKLDKKEFRNFFTTGFLMPLIITILSFIVLFFFRDYLKRTYGFPYEFVLIIPGIAFLTFCYEQLISLIRNNNDSKLFLKINIFKTFLELGISVILVVVFALRWKGRVVGILTAYIIIAIYAFYYFNKKGYLFGAFKNIYIYNELLYAIPIIVMQASVFVMTSSDKFFLSNFTSDHNATVGIYGIACVFASIINVLCIAYLQYLFPKIYTTLSADVIDYASIKRNFYFYLTVMLSGTVAFIGFTPLLYKYFINSKYYPALHYIYFLGIGYFFWTITYYFYSFLLFYKQKKRILILSLTYIAISFGSNYFFISNWGSLGAAISVCISYFIILIITLIAVRKYISQIFFNTRNNNETSK